MIEMGPEYRSSPHQLLAPMMIDDNYAGPIQAGPSFMQAVKDSAPYLLTSTCNRRLSESNLADHRRTKQAKSERWWKMSERMKLSWHTEVSIGVLT